ncbi:MAG: CoA-binding protein [Pirellulaceae bacterium]|nr:CoA-binding protein [Pirellulaceae bacterium]
MDPQLAFLQSNTFAVAGASNNRDKYGNRVFRALVDFTAADDSRAVYPIHPALETVEGRDAFARLADLPTVPDALSIITPPAVTKVIVQEAIAAGVKRIWMQPGAEHPDAITDAEEAGISVLAGGPCILVALITLV